MGAHLEKISWRSNHEGWLRKMRDQSSVCLLLKFTTDLGIWFDSILQFTKIRCIHKGDFYSHLCGYNFWKVPVGSYNQKQID